MYKFLLFFLVIGLATSSHKINPEPLIAIGYFLCGVAVLMTIGILIMTIKLKKLTIKMKKIREI
jgi:biotin transporter BioY